MLLESKMQTIFIMISLKKYSKCSGTKYFLMNYLIKPSKKVLLA